MKRLILVCFISLITGTYTSYAGKITFQISAKNPRNIKQPARIHSFLPVEVRPSDILDSQGLDIIYDVKRKIYAVHQDIELNPNENRTFDVAIKDIWQIPDELLTSLAGHAENLSSRLRKDTSDVQITIDDICARQNANTVPRVSAGKHIAAYRENMALLEKARSRLIRYENELIQNGKDPGQIVHAVTTIWPEKYNPADTIQTKTALIQIQVINTSPESARQLSIRRDLPHEILPDDVIDTDGLAIRTDYEKGLYYLHKEPVDLEPDSSVVFNVRIRDKWDIHDAKIKQLKSETAELLASIRFWRRYPSVEKALEEIQTRLTEISTAGKPTEFNEAYIAFFRNQGKEIDCEALAIERIKTIQFPSGSIGTLEPPPTRNTTWMIIYIILALLGISSLIVLSGCRLSQPQIHAQVQ